MSIHIGLNHQNSAASVKSLCFLSVILLLARCSVRLEASAQCQIGGKREVPYWVQLGLVQFASFVYEGLVTMSWGCHRGMRKIGPAEPSLNAKTILVNNGLLRCSLISSISVHQTNKLLVTKHNGNKLFIALFHHETPTVSKIKIHQFKVFLSKSLASLCYPFFLSGLFTTIFLVLSK